MNPTAPTSYPQVSEQEFSELAALDSCSVANAIERFSVQLRNEGYTEGEVTCRFPKLRPCWAMLLRSKYDQPLLPPKAKCFSKTPIGGTL